MSHRAASFVLLTVVAAAFPSFAADSPAAPVFVQTWSMPGCMVINPVFSPDGSDIAFEFRIYGSSLPTLAEMAGVQPKREYDPRIGLLRLSAQKFEELGYGREPAFAPDGRTLVFVAQANPSTLERIERPEHLWDNYLSLYTRESREKRVLAKPRAGFLRSPTFSPDGSRVVYLEASGAWARRVAIRESDVGSRKQQSIYEPPPIDDYVGGRFVETLQFGFFDGRLLARLAFPAPEAGATTQETEFREQIVEFRNGEAIPLFSFEGRNHSVQRLNRLRGNHAGGMIFDGGWRRFTNPAEPGPRIGPELSAFRDHPGVPSRDGRLIARTRWKLDGVMLSYTALVVEEIDTGKVVATFPVEKPRGVRTESITWSNDSRRLAWSDFATANWQDHDTLYVATLP